MVALPALAALAFWPSWSYAQTERAAANSSTPAAAIVTKVEEVSLDLAIRNRKGKPVSDLKAGDLQIFDDGSPAKISDLRFVNGSPGGHLVTLVFDRLEPAAARQARDAAMQLLKLAPSNGISFAVVEVEGRLRLFQEFTSDRQALKAAIGMATGKGKGDPAKESAAAEKELVQAARGAVSAPENRTMAQVMLTALEQSQRIAQDRHANPALSGLLALARAQQRIAGRKAVVYFAQGLELDSSGTNMLKSVVSSANRSGVSIYALDVQGLDFKATQGLMAAISMAGAMHAAGESPGNSVQAGGGAQPSPGNVLVTGGMQTSMGEQMGRIETNVATANRGPLANLSAGTGGIYIASAENPRKPLRHMLEDLTTYYEVSYVPAAEEDGRFRSVSIKPRRPGLIVKAPTGYFALPPGESGIRPFEEPLLKVLSAAQLPSDLEFRAAILHLGDTAFGNENSVVVEAPLSDVEIRQDPNTNLFAAHLSILAQIRNSSGAIVDYFSEDIPRQGALEMEQRARSETVTLERHFTAEPGQYILETVVMDRNNGEVGAQRTKFEIPASSSGPALSDVMLVRQTEPLSAGADPTEPLRYGDRLIIPNLSGQVPLDAKDVSLFFLIYPDPHSSEKPKLELELRKGGKSIGRVSLPMHPSTAGELTAHMASLQTKSLPAGSYQAAAIVTQGGNTVTRSVPFMLERPESASASAKPADGAGALPESAVSLSPTSLKESKLLVITPAASAVAPPPAAELRAIVASARQRASDYTDSLPNLICVEVTDRSVDPTGAGKWRHKDSIAELLRYHDKVERRTTLEVNGVHSDVGHADLQGTISYGEFGALLNAVFSPGAKADFHWKETGALANGTVQVFQYRVARENSMYGITASNGHHIKTGFHGLVYIDSATRGVRRLTLEADGLPPDFPIHSSLIAMDYAYIGINDHDYLLPVAGTITVREHKRHLVRNEIEFRNYRRYGAESSIHFGGGK